MDDIVLGGRTQAGHDERLRALFRRLSELGLTVNPKKCELGLKSISCLGCRVSAEGISMDPDKVEAIQSARERTNVSEVRGFLSLVSFCGAFIKDLATVSEPL